MIKLIRIMNNDNYGFENSNTRTCEKCDRGADQGANVGFYLLSNCHCAVPHHYFFLFHFQKWGELVFSNTSD